MDRFGVARWRSPFCGRMIVKADAEGTWVTIRGTHVLIKDGETVSQAFQRTTGKKLTEFESNIYEKRFKSETKEAERIKYNERIKNATSDYERQVLYTQRQEELGEQAYDALGEGPEELPVKVPDKIVGFGRNTTPNPSAFTETNFKEHYNSLSASNKSMIHSELGWKEGERFKLVMEGREKPTAEEIKKWTSIAKKQTYVWQP